jgi:nickel-dependent lactate racemase
MLSIKLKHSAWFGDKEFEITLPAEWDVDVYYPKKAGILSNKKIISKLDSFFENVDLSFVAQGGKVVFLLDDITRPTPVSRAVFHLAKKFMDVGLSKEDIILIIAGGTHEKMTEDELRIKLGDEIFDNFVVFPHDMDKNLRYHGKTSNNTPILINLVLGEVQK